VGCASLAGARGHPHEPVGRVDCRRRILRRFPLLGRGLASSSSRPAPSLYGSVAGLESEAPNRPPAEISSKSAIIQWPPLQSAGSRACFTTGPSLAYYIHGAPPRARWGLSPPMIRLRRTGARLRTEWQLHRPSLRSRRLGATAPTMHRGRLRNAVSKGSVGFESPWSHRRRRGGADDVARDERMARRFPIREERSAADARRRQPVAPRRLESHTQGPVPPARLQRNAREDGPMAMQVQAKSRCEGDLAPDICGLRPTRRATAQAAKSGMPNLRPSSGSSLERRRRQCGSADRLPGAALRCRRASAKPTVRKAMLWGGERWHQLWAEPIPWRRRRRRRRGGGC